MSRVLLAGFGGLGDGQDHQRAMYLPAFQAHPGFTVAGLTGDAGLAAELGVPCHPDLATALKESDADVVSVCLPAGERAEAIVTALRAGRHVLADKPLALTAAETEAVAAAADEAGAVCMPAHHQRFAPAIRSAKAAVAGGRVGLPWNVQADFLVAGGEPCPLGELTNFGVYPLDIVQALTGQAVRRVHARSDRGVTVLLLDHDHGLTSTISVGRIQETAGVRPGGLVLHRYRISGSNGVMNVDAAKPAATVRTASGVRAAWTGPDTVTRMLTELHAAIAGGRRAEVGPADALAVVRVVEAAGRSLATGRPVSLSQEGRS